MSKKNRKQNKQIIIYSKVMHEQDSFFKYTKQRSDTRLKLYAQVLLRQQSSNMETREMKLPESWCPQTWHDLKTKPDRQRKKKYRQYGLNSSGNMNAKYFTQGARITVGWHNAQDILTFPNNKWLKIEKSNYINQCINKLKKNFMV